MADHNVAEEAVAVPQIPTEPQVVALGHDSVVADDENDGPIIEADVERSDLL